MLKRRLLTLLLAAAGVGWSVAAIMALAQPFRAVTSYAAVSAAAAAALLVPGLGLHAAGWLAARDAGTGSLSPLCVLASAAWLAPVLVGWDGGPPIVRSAGLVAAPFLAPALAHLVLAAPTGRVSRLLGRTALTVVYPLATLASVGHAMTWDPFRDPYCWSDCTDNVFLVAGDPGRARWIEQAWLGTGVAVGVFTLMVATRRLAAATPVARAVGWPVIAPAALAATLEAGYAVARLAHRAEGPDVDLFGALFLARAAALAALASGVLWLLWCRRRRHRALVTLVDELDRPADTGSLQATLSRQLGDSSLTVAYWLPHSARYVDRSGRQVHPSAGPGRALTSIVRDGAPLAVMCHEREILDDRTLRQRVGSAALLAIDNERLSAELLAQLESLRASQRRIVAAADQARRRIERDLHDGAQQRLLAVLYELRLARSDPSRRDGEVLALDMLIDSAQHSLADLRDLAHGIFPAILDDAGLKAALWTVVDQATTIVELGAMPDRRLPAATEQVAYLVVTETLAGSRPGPDSTLSIDASLRGDTLVMNLDGAPAPPSQYLRDRIGASDGVLTHRTGVLHVEIPCG